MVAFYLIEGTLLVLLAVALLTHVACGLVAEMLDRAARRAEQENPPQLAKVEVPAETASEDDTELDDDEPDESWLQMPVLVGTRRDSLRL
jgi:hypothetical protein